MNMGDVGLDIRGLNEKGEVVRDARQMVYYEIFKAETGEVVAVLGNKPAQDPNQSK